MHHDRTSMGKSDALSPQSGPCPERGQQHVTLLCPEFFAAHAIRPLRTVIEGEERDILRDIHKGTTRASRRTQLRSLQRNSEGLRESHSERQWSAA